MQREYEERQRHYQTGAHHVPRARGRASARGGGTCRTICLYSAPKCRYIPIYPTISRYIPLYPGISHIR